MKIKSIRTIENYTQIIQDIRNSGYIKLNNIQLTGRNSNYPNCLLASNDELYSPYDERVMSLKKESFYDNNEFDYSLKTVIIHHKDPVFFFIYNVDNYYHFIYDTLPILYFYKLFQKELPLLQLLINTSHPSKQTLPQFVTESLEILDIKNIIFSSENTLYKTMFIGTSFTHGGFSNKPPSDLCFPIWNQMILPFNLQFPKRIYISRRSQLSKNPGNIGTNYTMRRRCENEDTVVELLKKYNITEVFCEDLTMNEKIQMFTNAELIVGFIGGGMANCIFSKVSTKVLCLVSPTFLEINKRFAHLMNHTQVTYLYNCSHAPSKEKYTLYTRVKIVDPYSKYFSQIGEIENINNKIYTITISRNDVAGFSQDFKMEVIKIAEEFLEPLDEGLNSPFICNLNQVEEYLNNLLD